MKKNTFVRMLTFVLAVFSMLAFAACNEEADGQKSSLDYTNDTMPDLSKNDEPEIDLENWGADEKYKIVYVSNGDGTCYVSEIYTNPNNKGEYEIDIPEKSPEGDTVTAVRCAPFSSLVPRIIAKEDFEKNIYEPLKAGIEASDRSDIEKKFLLNNTFMSRFTFIDPDKMTSDRALADLYKEVPVCHVTAVYMVDINLNAREEKTLVDLIEEYTNYDFESLSYTYSNLCEMVKNSDVEDKDKIIESIPQIPDAVSNGITSINFADTVTDVDKNFCNYLYDVKEIKYFNDMELSGLYIEKVVFADNVTSIGDGAFSACTVLTSITIPDSVTSIGYGAFSGCTGLTTITLPTGITSISSYAFSRCCSLTTITIPDSVTSIGYGAFSACIGLTSISIPDSVTSIDSQAFKGCRSLTSINYSGTQKQWNSIANIGKVEMEIPQGCTIHCTDGGIVVK